MRRRRRKKKRRRRRRRERDGERGRKRKRERDREREREKTERETEIGSIRSQPRLAELVRARHLGHVHVLGAHVDLALAVQAHLVVVVHAGVRLLAGRSEPRLM